MAILATWSLPFEYCRQRRRVLENVLFQGVTNITLLGGIIGPNYRVLRGYFQSTIDDFVVCKASVSK